MNLLAGWILAVGLVLLCSLPSAAENKQEQGEKLIQRAEQLSDIRSPDAPAFRLKSTFKELGSDAPGTEGTYTETWVSRGRWRRETILGDFHRTEVGGAKSRWILDSVPEIPGKTGDLAMLMHIVVLNQQPIKVAAIRDQTLQGSEARCVYLKPNDVGTETLCIDAQRGVLLLSKLPTLRMGRKSDEYSCQYSEYEQFEGRMYPREIQCTGGNHPGIEVRVLELSRVSLADTALFEPPVGAKELTNCPGKMRPPKLLHAFDAEYPKDENQPSSPEVLWIIVGADGKPRDLRVAHSIGRAFDKPALEAVGRWVFKPATCDGDPASIPINVEVNFRK